jgi:hypothetical protein
MNAYRADRAWADGYEPQLRLLAASYGHVVVTADVASAYEDRCHATDFVLTLAADASQVAARVRSHDYFERFGDFTLRESRPSGAMTEEEKIVAGFARWYLYCWETNGRLTRHLFVDLDRFRERPRLLATARRGLKNADGTTFLAISPVALFLAGCLVGSEGVALPQPWRPIAPPPDRPPASPQLKLFM